MSSVERRHRCAAVAGAFLILGLVVAVPVAPASGSTNLIVNGSFEEPDVRFGTFGIFASIPGWSHAARPGTTSTGIEIQDHVAGAPAPGAGDQFAELDSNGPSVVFQDVATVPNGLYRLEFLFTPRPFTAAVENHFRVTAGSASMEIGPMAGGSATNWQTRSLEFVADSSVTRIEFFDLGPEQAAGGAGAYVDLVSVVRVNRAPNCTAAVADPASLTPPRHNLRPVHIGGISDPDGDAVSITIDGVTQDEPVNGVADGNTAPDAILGPGSSEVKVRAERSGVGDGRVYRIAFTATDPNGGSCAGVVTVGVPHDQRGAPANDSMVSFDSTTP